MSLNLKLSPKLGDALTFKAPLTELLESLGGDYAQFMDFHGTNVIRTSRHPGLTELTFPETGVPSIQKALQGHGNSDLIRLNDRLYDVISVPGLCRSDLIGGFHLCR